MSNWIELAASVAAILLVVCVLLAWRRVTAMQAQLDKLSNAINTLKSDHERALIRSLNLSKSRKTRKSSRPSSDTLEEKMTSSIAPKQPEENEFTGSADNLGERALNLKTPGS
jgi:Tfp pilus assembly protein PilO